jgi:fumarylacetoacetate (FAA) hydrolase
MKLGTLRNGEREGMFVVVSKDLNLVCPATDIAKSLREGLENWEYCEPRLRTLSDELSAGNCRSARRVTAEEFMAPMPRAFQLLDGGGYLPHFSLGFQLRKAEIPAEFEKIPTFYQSVSDPLLAPKDPIRLPSDDVGVDFEAELAIVVDDVPMGVPRASAGGHVKLVGLMNDVSLRGTQLREFKAGFGFFQCKPKKAFAPVFVTPDELGEAWDGNALRVEVCCDLNGQRFGNPNAGIDPMFGFPQMVEEAARQRILQAGTIIGCGTVSNWDRTKGQCCINERRVLELLNEGKARTPFMKFGDRVRIEVFDEEGASIFGAIDQQLVRA